MNTRNRAQTWSMVTGQPAVGEKMCGAYPFVGYCGLFLNEPPLPKMHKRLVALPGRQAAEHLWGKLRRALRDRGGERLQALGTELG